MFGAATVLDDVSIALAPGELVVLLGPSGCGKTTTLRVVAGFTAPSRGQVLIDGTDVTHVAPRRRKIGMVFQSYALFPNMTVAENVGFGLRQRRDPRAAIRKRVDELLALVRLSDKRDNGVQNLSGGQQQRVALARALACAPRVLLMDEPFGALDLKLREAMQTELRRIQRSFGITTLLVTHDQHEALSLADRVVIMHGGRIQQAATPDEIYARPANRFVAGFIGKNNFLRGRVTQTANRLAQVDVGGALVPVHDPDGSLRPGVAIELAIRPEHIGLAPSDDPGRITGERITGEPITGEPITGEIVARSFAGSLTHYTVRVAAGDMLLVEQPSGHQMLAPGERVVLAWAPENAVLLDSEPAP
jgi:ABC-type Fe3+/spermidine/putrescine transport system ATPase subunit